MVGASAQSWISSGRQRAVQIESRILHSSPLRRKLALVNRLHRHQRWLVLIHCGKSTAKKFTRYLVSQILGIQAGPSSGRSNVQGFPTRRYNPSVMACVQRRSLNLASPVVYMDIKCLDFDLVKFFTCSPIIPIFPTFPLSQNNPLRDHVSISSVRVSEQGG